ncbi:MAG: type IX secretion system outer membrane channel protein PorV [Bacteroidia bacterium]|nr:type IX secretion system outer membrane channel protein PorV [Bacteroidia bacterium]MCX7764392.1 type IX secretion system outer membrane channel protein PorV [Bacteroidia bacterium]MDW8058072.1 type IX secretion system outer membrane channel protein PorV [Bacteroidia bacterium]
MIKRLVLLIGVSAHAFGQPQSTPTGQIRAITTAVPFLLICPDARSGGMAETGVALPPNMYSMHWNVGALAAAESRMGIAFSYTPWLRALGIGDINHFYLPFYAHLGERAGTIGASMTFFSLGRIEFTDNAGLKTGEYEANEFAISTAYSRLLASNLSAGVALKYIQSNLVNATTFGSITTRPGRSVAGDFGLFYQKDLTLKVRPQAIPTTLRWGIQVSNIGAKMTYTTSGQRDFLPTNLRIGYSFTFKINDFNSFTIANDYNKLLVPSAGGAAQVPLLEGMFKSFADAPGGWKEELAEVYWSLGAEYNYNQVFRVRGGFFYEDPLKGNRRFITLGAGLQLRRIGADVAYLTSLVQNHPLQNTLRFTLFVLWN